MDDPRIVNRLGMAACLALCLVAATLTWFTGLAPIQAWRAEAAELERAIAILSPIGGQAEALTSEVRALRERVEAATVPLPDDPDLNQILSDVGRQADEAGVSIERLTPGDVVTGDRFRKMSLDLRVLGDFVEIFDFVDGLESAEGATRLRSMTVLGSERPGECSSDVRLTLYFESEKGRSG